MAFKSMHCGKHLFLQQKQYIVGIPYSLVGTAVTNDQAQPRRVSGVGWSDWLGCSGNILVLSDKFPYHRHELGWHLHDGLLGVK